MGRLALILWAAMAAAPDMGSFTLTVRDGATRAPVAVRVHLRDWDGKVVKVSEHPYWHDHYAVDGASTIALPTGYYRYTIERGPEFDSANGVVSIHAGENAEVIEQILRLIDMPARGWWPGDLHVHRPVEDIEVLMRAEALHIAPVITWWNAKNYWTERAIPRETVVKFDSNRFYEVMAGEDERNGGAYLYFHRNAPMDFRGYDKEYPFPFAGDTFAKNNAATWTDIEKPFWWDVPAAIAFGRGDSIGLANNHMCRSGMYESEAWGRARDSRRLPSPRGNGYWSQEIYYELLNCGLRIPPSAGSASGVLPNPVGYNRVYVQVEGPLTWEAWWGGLRAGRTFVTNGPMLMVKANGELPGHVFHAKNGIVIALEAEILSADAIPYIEIIKNGEIVRRVPFEDWRRTGSLGIVSFDESGWFLVRAVTDNAKTFRFASTAPYYVEVGRSKTRISRQSAEFFRDWVRERIARVQHDDAAKKAELIRDYGIAERFWDERMKRANAE